MEKQSTFLLADGGSIPTSPLQFTVRRIPSSQTHEWLLKKHYAHRLPMAIEHAIGLYDQSMVLQGVCVLGPTAPPVPVTIFGEHHKHIVRELTRLVVNEGLCKNILSFFVSKSLVILPKPMCLVSFADSNAGHRGYIYQAANWIYTGEGGGATSIVDANGIPVHNITITDGCTREHITRKAYFAKYGITETDALPKHRYLYFIGSKRETRKMKDDCLLKSLPYPKGDNKRYDAGYEPPVQGVLV
tara:strand:- start:296 stop:1027 length:732 start_codon:yes stop_codon:yes gene_type:complete